MEAGVENRWSKIREFLACRFWHYIPCLCHVWTIHRRCPANRRQWADFLVSLRAPLHRQYKTARTETRWHLLLKIRQMPIQTSASRGYILFDIKVAFMPPVVWCRKGHTQKSYKLSSGMRTWPAECSKLGKTRIIEDADIRLARNATFFEPNFHLYFHMKSTSAFLIILLLIKAWYAYCDSSFVW